MDQGEIWLINLDPTVGAEIKKTAPKVVYLQLGNCILKELHKYFTANWDSIISKLDLSSMVILKKDQILTFE